MNFPWRLRRRGAKRRGAAGKNINGGFSDMELMTMIPNHFRCPISLDLMKDPVTLSTGITYDRENIEKWIEDGNQTCPVTNQVLRSFDQIPNHSIRKMIQEWCVENKSFGIERIPTPRIPVTPYEVSEISSDISAATALGDANRCRELVSKIKTLARESERNKKRIKENGVGLVLSASFEAFSGVNNNNYEELLKNLLSTITWMFPLGAEGQSKIGSEKSLRTIAWFLNGEDLSTRQHAVTVLKELLAADNSYANILVEIEADNIINIPEALFKIIKFPICQEATKASLMVIYHIMLWLSSSSTTSNNKIVSKFLDTGLVSLLIEMIFDAEKNVSEKALGVLDVITNWEEGKEKVRGNALAMPLMVKKILRVSDLATEFSISILWKLCKGGGGGELDQDHHENDQSRVIIEAMQVGAFQKLLVTLQVGCGEKTKEKTTELLKLMNLYKDRVDCVDSSSGFKYIKRPF